MDEDGLILEHEDPNAIAARDLILAALAGAYVIAARTAIRVERLADGGLVVGTAPRLRIEGAAAATLAAALEAHSGLVVEDEDGSFLIDDEPTGVPLDAATLPATAPHDDDEIVTSVEVLEGENE